jgi:hypothetical protein
MSEPSAAAPSLRGGAEALRLRALADELRVVLGRVKHAVDTEIAAYPTPIPRCDAQFNHLYEERACLASLLAQLDAALARDDDDAIAAALAEFAAAPAAREDAAAIRLRAQIGHGLARSG